MMRYIIISIGLVVATAASSQQDVMLTQFMYNKLSLNPAYAGEYDYANLTSLSSPGLVKGDIDFDTNNELSQEVRHVYLMGGATFGVADRVDFTPQLLMKYAENAPFDIDLNFGLTLDERYTGAVTYRFGGASGDVGESIDVLLSFQLSEQLLLGFSLDFTLSELRSYDNGSLELLARYSFVKTGSKVKMINPRYF